MADAPVSQDDQKKQNKRLLDYLNKLRDAAKKSHPTKRLKRLANYYAGESDDINNESRFINTDNICQPIVETKTALVLDMEMGMVARPSDMNLLTDERSFEIFSTMAEVVTGCLWNIFRNNQFETIKADIVRNLNIYGTAILHTTWNKSMAQGMGDAETQLVDPLNFFPDPTANRIKDAGYVFIRSVESKFELKKQYPDLWDEIDKLKGIDDSSNVNKDKDQNSFLGIPLTFLGGNNTGTSGFSNGNQSSTSGLNAIKNYEIWTCYIKDDSIFYPDQNDTSGDNEMKIAQLQYPYGRYVRYCETLKLEDRAIPYPYGLPIDVVYNIKTRGFWGRGEIDQIQYLQDQINDTNMQINQIRKTHISAILYENFEGGFEGIDFPQTDAIELMVGTMAANASPRHLTNSHIEQIQYLRDHVQFLTNQALQVVRLNPALLTGQKQSGVTSGDMVEDLNESPLASIRSTQRAMMSFMYDVCAKLIKIVQLYYTEPRIVRISEGKKIARISPTDQQIEIFDNDPTQQLINQKAIEIIKGDLSIGDYEIEPIPESMQYQTQAEIARQTIDFAERGYLGDTSDIFIKEQILRRSGFRNYQVFISRIKQIQLEAQKNPPNVASLLEKLTGSIKDLPEWAQVQILKQEGFNPPPGLYPPEITDIPAPKQQPPQ